MNRVVIRRVFPFSETAEPYDCVLISEEWNVFSVLHYPGSPWVAPSRVFEVARGVFDAYFRRCTDSSDIMLHHLVERIARAIRQFGEMLECGATLPQLARITGDNFVASHARNALGVRLEGAFVWVQGTEAHLASVGSCTVFLLRGGRIQLLNQLNTLAQDNETNVSQLGVGAYRIVTSTMGAEPDRLVGALSHQCVSLEPGDRIIMTSPTIGVPIVVAGIQPDQSAESVELSSTADWFVQGLAATSDTPTDRQGVVIAIGIS